VKRRDFITLLGGAAAWPMPGLGQTAPKRPLIGFLAPGSKTTGGPFYSGFLQGMQERGYFEGRDYSLQTRYADSDLTRLPVLAEELVHLRPDVIVAGASGAAHAAKQATNTIPIVGVNLLDPVAAGLVNSEARPGTNLTGNLVRLQGLTGKQVEIARELVPSATRIGLLVNGGNPTNVVQRQEAEASATKLEVRLAIIEVRARADLGSAFQAFAREHTNVVLIPTDVLFVNARRQIAAFALSSRLFTVFPFREHVEDGGLISYGVNLRTNYRHAAYYVDRILKGANPADLPIEFLPKLELVINIATARALGLEIPPTLLARADEVIE
jgi:putative tryptophan/tyrosine transport system substrate-binding protein